MISLKQSQLFNGICLSKVQPKGCCLAFAYFFFPIFFSQPGDAYKIVACKIISVDICL